MQNQNAAKTPGLDLTAWLEMLKPDSQQHLINFIRDAKHKGGKEWLAEIKTEFPTLCWIVELVATKTADESLEAVAKLYPLVPVKILAGEQIKALHGKLLEEIERKR